MKIFLALLILSLAEGAPAPQDLTLEPDSEIEFFDLPAAEDLYEDDGPIVIVIKPTAFLPKLPRLPSLPPLPKFDSFPRIPHPLEVFERDGAPHPLDVFEEGIPHPFNIFGKQDEVPQIPNFLNFDKETECGFLCQLLGGLKDKVDDGIKSVFGGEFDHHNHTYDEKVLADGSVLRVNRTTIHDTDEEGNGFFFQTSVHHIVPEEGIIVDEVTSKTVEGAADVKVKEEEETEKDENDITDTEEQDEKNDKPDNTGEDTLPAINEPSDVVVGETKNIVIEDIDLGDADEEENEIEVDVLPTIDVSGIDDGLFQ